jgi:hypothetical protein
MAVVHDEHLETLHIPVLTKTYLISKNEVKDLNYNVVVSDPPDISS